MLYTHCVHPLCNLPSSPVYRLAVSKTDMILDWEGLPGLASTGVVFTNALLSCLSLPSPSAKTYVLLFLCHCLPSVGNLTVHPIFF